MRERVETPPLFLFEDLSRSCLVDTSGISIISHPPKKVNRQTAQTSHPKISRFCNISQLTFLLVCDILLLSRGRETKAVEWTCYSVDTRKTFWKKFKKPLDNRTKVWYNKNVKRARQQKLTEGFGQIPRRQRWSGKWSVSQAQTSWNWKKLQQFSKTSWQIHTDVV